MDRFLKSTICFYKVINVAFQVDDNLWQKCSSKPKPVPIILRKIELHTVHRVLRLHFELELNRLARIEEQVQRARPPHQTAQQQQHERQSAPHVGDHFALKTEISNHFHHIGLMKQSINNFYRKKFSLNSGIPIAILPIFEIN